MKCCIGIEDGKIGAIQKVLKGAKHYDLGENIILPGAIDGRVRLYKPRFSKTEDFQSGTAAAAHGGVTCVIDMCDSKPPIISYDALWDKIHYCRRRALIDFGSYAYATPLTAKKELISAAAGFYLEQPGISVSNPIRSNAQFEASISRLASHDKLLTIYSEDPTAIPSQADEASNAVVFNQLRSSTAETEGITSVLKLLPKGPMNITGLTSLEAIGLINDLNAQNRSREQGQEQKQNYTQHPITFMLAPFIKITTEVTPHHLLLHTENIASPVWKAWPPLRDGATQTALLSWLNAGAIDMVVSDHRAVVFDAGDVEGLNYYVGFPGVETMVPLLLSLVRQERLHLARLVQTTATNPARRFGLHKGIIECGYDADLMVIDFRNQEPLRSEMLMTKCGWTPFEKFPGIFPKMTMARGEVVMEDHTIVADHGRGRSVPDPSV